MGRGGVGVSEGFGKVLNVRRKPDTPAKMLMR